MSISSTEVIGLTDPAGAAVATAPHASGRILDINSCTTDDEYLPCTTSLAFISYRSSRTRGLVFPDTMTSGGSGNLIGTYEHDELGRDKYLKSSSGYLNHIPYSDMRPDLASDYVLPSYSFQLAAGGQIRPWTVKNEQQASASYSHQLIAEDPLPKGIPDWSMFAPQDAHDGLIAQSCSHQPWGPVQESLSTSTS
jgi:hypothetical protein